jgi:hypothetical protein
MVHIVTGYVFDSSEIEFNFPCPSRGPLSLLYNGYRVLSGKKWPERGAGQLPLLGPRL